MNKILTFKTLFTNYKIPQKSYSAAVNEKLTHFGFDSVQESDKEKKVYQVFENVADNYDLMNDAMSGGIHRIWKDYFVSNLHPVSSIKVLDVAGGTGDIAFRILKWLKLKSLSGHVTILDINKPMMKVGQKKAALQKYDSDISWVEGNAEYLPMQNDSFDAYTCAFGIRNMTHIDIVLEEAFRVLKPGGRFMCLEFSQVSNPIIKSIYDKYSFEVIPVIGHLLANDWHSYKYLVESIRRFPDQEEFSDMITDAGFSQVTYTNLLFGVATIHSAFKL